MKAIYIISTFLFCTSTFATDIDLLWKARALQAQENLKNNPAECKKTTEMAYANIIDPKLKEDLVFTTKGGDTLYTLVFTTSKGDTKVSYIYDKDRTKKPAISIDSLAKDMTFAISDTIHAIYTPDCIIDLSLGPLKIFAIEKKLLKK